MKMKDNQFFFSLLQVMEHRWNEIDREKPKYSGEKPVPVPLCPPQIPHGLTQEIKDLSIQPGSKYADPLCFKLLIYFAWELSTITRTELRILIDRKKHNIYNIYIY
jgi:hypothetical protein